MGLSAAVNWAISIKLLKVARQTDSAALLADGMRLRTDVWTSLGVMAGLAAIGLGRKLLPGADWDWLDPLAALLVALLIVKAAWDLTKDGVQALPGPLRWQARSKWLRHAAHFPPHPSSRNICGASQPHLHLDIPLPSL